MQTACINAWSVISVLLGSFELDNVSLVPYILRHHKVYRTNRRFEQYAMVSYSNQLVVLLNVFLAQYYSRTAFLGYSSICETIDGSRFEASLEVVCRNEIRRAGTFLVEFFGQIHGDISLKQSAQLRRVI